MSVPKSLELPEGVTATTLQTPRGEFAAHTAFADEPVGHVLLIPGWTGSKEDFTPVLPLLAAAGFDVTTYDQRGQFETVGRPHDDYSLPGLAADAVAVRATSGRPASHVMGHSFGGLVAQHATTLQPDAWLSLSLLCTGPGALGESSRRPLKKPAAAIGKVPLLDLHAAA
ncbi:alpha/beta fold hydrolase [Aeromicrobium sp. UC242_57]|uniref:alpha/beta fold hydrolase n=1 Tax=Aeromicrobium sp. UC242_57 TaxID=3374624 RepID=UPI0037B77071